MDIRNLEQIQERDNGQGARRLVPWLLAAGGVGAISLTLALTGSKQRPSTVSPVDPLGDLIAQAQQGGKVEADTLTTKNTSFAKILNDRERPSVAFVAVKDGNGRLIPLNKSLEKAPLPIAGDKLPVVPIPAGKVLEVTSITKQPSDPILALAVDRTQFPKNSPLADTGAAGQYQIQVASFRTEQEAKSYVRELRLRGHQAHSQAARVPNRGLWFRVRIGPFKHKYSAVQYKADFEKKEKMATLLVDPHKVERREAQRAAKLAARARRKKRRSR